MDFKVDIKLMITLFVYDIVGKELIKTQTEVD